TPTLCRKHSPLGESLMHRRAAHRFGRATLLICVGVSLALAAGCSAEPAQNLRGPAPQVGQVYRDEAKLTMAKGTMTVTTVGLTQTTHQDVAGEGVFETEVLAVAEGRMTTCRTRLVTERGKDTVRGPGQTETHTDINPLEGETILSEKVGEAWKTTLVGKVP